MGKVTKYRCLLLASCNDVLRRTQHHSGVSLPKNAELEFNHKETSKNSNWVTFYKITSLLFNFFHVMKNMKNNSLLKGTKET